MYHNLVVTACGRVYSFGNGSSGQLGHRSKKDRLVPKRIRALRDVHCVTASGGWNHSLVATLDGRVFSFGDGSNGKLGHGNDASQATPLPILALGALFVVEIAAGDGYSLVATDKGKIFAFGTTTAFEGATEGPSVVDEAAKLLPRAVEAFQRSGLAVRKISCNNHTLVVT